VPETVAPRPKPVFACVYLPGEDRACDSARLLQHIAQNFSPRFELHHNRLIVIDASGLERMMAPRSRPGLEVGSVRSGAPSENEHESVIQTIGEELRREAFERGLQAHVALASTRTAAILLAHTNSGLTLLKAENDLGLAPIPIGILERCADVLAFDHETVVAAVAAFKRWGVRTLGELVALPAAELSARFGRAAMTWQSIARGEDTRPLIPTLPDERFESSLQLEWPIEELEPLSFVLTRLLEPLSVRLERRDRGVAVLHLLLRLITKETYTRRLELPSPLRDVRTLRTLAILDLESHPPTAAIDRVTVVIDPTPGRVVQHTLFTRARPTPEQLSTLIARLGALMGQDRLGAPAVVDSYRPGVFAMTPFAPDTRNPNGEVDRTHTPDPRTTLLTALRRCRQPVPARVVVEEGRPVRVTTDRRGFAGGSVLDCAGPWRTSGEWWLNGELRIDNCKLQIAESMSNQQLAINNSGRRPWDRDEWDVKLSDGANYRVFCDRETGHWLIDAVID
jgi:protein ImuB